VASFVAVFDACVLYPAPLRDLLIRLGLTGLFRAQWSAEIHDEWMRAVLRERPGLQLERLARTRELMDEALPDATVTGHEELIAQLRLPDPKDRHVLAVAIRCQAGVIVTYNLKDFPHGALEPYGLEAQHPDEFVTHLFDLDPARVCAAVRDQRAALRSPPVSLPELLDTFRRAGLATTVSVLESMSELL
jgi:predicted nucleic acid-binding protein